MKRKIVAVLALLVGVINAFADIKVSDVKVFSGYPWKEVVVGYTITGTTNVSVVVGLSATDQTANKTYVAGKLSGAETLPGRHIMKWDAFGDGVKLRSEKTVFSVKISDPMYCIVDLSGGANAASYPVSYAYGIPGGSQANEYKTTKLILRRLEAGSFVMQGVASATLTRPFYIGIFEVTQKQWKQVMGSDSYSGSPVWGNGDAYPVRDVSYDMIRGGNSPFSAASSNSFIGKLQAKTGLDFDLPTEAQWEYACRAETRTTYYWGDSIDEDYAWYHSNAGLSSHPVGAKEPNGWGLYDMIGNVGEYCLGWYGTLSYGLDPLGPLSGDLKVARGGNFGSEEGDCTSSSRLSSYGRTGSMTCGFRVAQKIK